MMIRCAGIAIALTVLATTANSEPILLQIEQHAYLKASNTQSGDRFGSRVAVFANTVVVAALSEDSSATGINGNQSDNGASTSGAVYVIERHGPVWGQQAYLKASNTNPNDLFGYSLSISGDTIVVGASRESSSSNAVNGNELDNSAPNAGAAYVFTRAGFTWTQQAYLKAGNSEAEDFFGDSVAVDGNTIVVGASSESSSATGVNGDGTDNSADESGAAYVFVRTGGTWNQQAYLKASNADAFDRFGRDVAICGDLIVVGAELEDGPATSVNGDASSNTGTDNGAAYVFRRTGTTWVQEAYLKASNNDDRDNFGFSVDVSGNTIIVGAPLEESGATLVNGDENSNSEGDSGAAYVFVYDGTGWSQQAYLKASNTDSFDNFGASVSIDGDLAFVGAPDERSNEFGLTGLGMDNSLERAGAAYMYSRTGSTWQFDRYVKASNTGFGDEFGGSVDVSGGQYVAGASKEGSSATGFNGDQGDDGSASSAGAAYVFAEPTGELSFCFGDGLGRPCKCGNDDALQPNTGGCLNSNGTGAVLSTNAQTSAASNSLEFSLNGGVPTALAVLTSGANFLGAGIGILGLPESDGLRCVGGNLRRHGARSLDVTGSTSTSWGATGAGPPGGIIAGSGFVPGQSRYFQVRYREDPLLGPCGFGTNTSQAIELIFVP